MTCCTTATAAWAARYLIFSRSDMKSSGRNLRTTFSISSLEMLVMRPPSYCFMTHLWIAEMPGWRLSMISPFLRSSRELIQWTIPALPDLSVISSMMGRFRIFVVSKML